ncbi:MAG: hypothetical protein J5532_10425 [Lachnospiraceae bacterium]|nr:hypothetical protein [Lachnospiraceae bacterium]
MNISLESISKQYDGTRSVLDKIDLVLPLYEEKLRKESFLGCCESIALENQYQRHPADCFAADDSHGGRRCSGGRNCLEKENNRFA